jgi:glycosyltransferase involved in cell wall biosynthesis
MDVSVVISTYNAPDWLGKAVWGWAAQDDRDFELVIADDGSHAATRECIVRLRGETGLTIRHVWHEDDGFRKWRILNRAIQEAGGDYCIFSDGDCVPRADFVAVHRRLARPRHFLSGGYLKLPLVVSEALTTEDVTRGRVSDAGWLRAHGMPNSYRLPRLSRRGLGAQLMDLLTTTRAGWNGHNASGWKADIIGVNGFDERMAWGGGDRELGERLANAGIRSVQIRHRAICVHLEHARGYVDEGAVRRNLAIRRETHLQRAVWTPYGIVKDASPSPAPATSEA